MSDETKTLLAAVLILVLLTPAMVGLVRAAKRNGSAVMMAGLLLFTFGKMFGGGAEMEFVETVKDPERKKRSENGDPLEPGTKSQSLLD